jgi:hypothetical protein
MDREPGSPDWGEIDCYRGRSLRGCSEGLGGEGRVERFLPFDEEFANRVRSRTSAEMEAEASFRLAV